MRFEGEENISVKDLQDNFFSCIKKSDAYVICNLNSYEGLVVTIELGYAAQCIESSLGNLKKIYFTNVPVGYDKFDANIGLSFDTFLINLYNDLSYRNELKCFLKMKENVVGGYSSEKEFYYDLKNFYMKISSLKSKGNLIIGIESLLDRHLSNQNISKSKQTSISDEYEH